MSRLSSRKRATPRTTPAQGHRRIVIVTVAAALGLAGCGSSHYEIGAASSQSASAPASSVTSEVPVTESVSTSAPVPVETVYVTASSSMSTAASPAPVTRSSTPAKPTTPSVAPAARPEGSKRCGVVARKNVYAWGHYSCPFAMNVISTYRNGGDLDHVHSPLTGKTYAVTCMAPGGRLSCAIPGEQGLMVSSPN